MRTSFSIVLVPAVVFATLTVAAPQPARADMDEATFVDCTQTYAEWTWSDPKLNPSKTAHPIAPPKGTDTYIFTCRVGRHDVRINFISQPWGNPHCGAVAYDAVSMWVDGVKIVNNQEYGDMPSCQSSPQTTPYKMIVNKDLRMTVCEGNLGDDERRPCRLTTLDLSGKTRDPAHTGPVKRTIPALVLIDDKAPAVCEPLTGEANLSLRQGDDDGVYRKHALKEIATSNDDDRQTMIRTFTLDIDNNGVADQVTGTYDVAGRQFSWRSGASGKTTAIDLPLLGYENTNWFQNKVSDFLGFVRIGGKTYLYEGDLWLLSGSPDVTTAHVDAMMGADPRFKSQPSHRLYRLTPDGKAELMCSWAPRQRPEEYM